MATRSLNGRPAYESGVECPTLLYKVMLDESYVLQYKSAVLADMSDSKREVFEGPLKKFVISTTCLYDVQVVCFHFYQDHLIEAVTKWPWLLCSNLGAHLERSYDEESPTYNHVVGTGYKFGWTKAKP